MEFEFLSSPTVRGSQGLPRLMRPFVGFMLFFFVPMAEQEMVGNVTIAEAFDDALKAPVAFFARLALDIRDFMWNYKHFANDIFSPSEADHVETFVFGQDGPMKVVVVKQSRLPRTRSQNAVGVFS